jgi:hypothetical protein
MEQRIVAFRCRSHTFTSAGSPIFEAVLHGRHLCGVIVPTIAASATVRPRADEVMTIE